MGRNGNQTKSEQFQQKQEQELATKWNSSYFNCVLLYLSCLKHMANSVACVNMFAYSPKISFL
jgi:hypothetical protein